MYLHREFKFSDGSTGEKFFIVVNSPSERENYLVCKTTSQEKPPYRIKKQGCSFEKHYFMFLAKEDWFCKDTWIQFKGIYEFQYDQLLKDKFGGKADYKSELKDKNTRAVLNCILKSNDVPENYLNSVKTALKGLRKKHNES